MHEIKAFEFEAKPVRIVTGADGDPRWVARDVADALGYTWSGSRLQHVPQEWRGMTSVVTPSGTQEMAVLTEQGLYFFLGRSDKPAALPFQKWIAGEVLPAIRKTGEYRAHENRRPGFDIPRTLPTALRVLADVIEERDDLRDQLGRLTRPMIPAPPSAPVADQSNNLHWRIPKWLCPENLRVSEDGKFFETTPREALMGAFGLERGQIDSSDVAMAGRIMRNHGWTRDGARYILPRGGK